MPACQFPLGSDSEFMLYSYALESAQPKSSHAPIPTRKKPDRPQPTPSTA